MELKEQVTSLESSERLKELGVVQRSIFFWELHSSSIPELVFVKVGKIVYAIENEYISAFTVAELGEMLPVYIRTYRVDDGFICSQKQFTKNANTFEDTEAEARAKMLIYLLEKKLI